MKLNGNMIYKTLFSENIAITQVLCLSMLRLSRRYADEDYLTNRTGHIAMDEVISRNVVDGDGGPLRLVVESTLRTLRDRECRSAETEPRPAADAIGAAVTTITTTSTSDLRGPSCQ